MNTVVVIGSKNRAKVSAVKDAFKRVFPRNIFIFKSLPVESGVSRQPLTEKETVKGAMNRIKGCKKIFPDADYWVGIEGGVQPTKDGLLLVEWVCVLDKHNDMGKGRGLSFVLPTKVTEYIKKGLNVGESNDKIFKKKNTGDSIGLVGTLTKKIIKRKDFLRDACIIALIRFTNRKLY